MAVESRKPAVQGQTVQTNPKVEDKPADPAWAWAPYEPDAQRPWGLPLAGHLYRRAGFGADWNQLQQAVADGPQKTVDRLIAPTGDVAAFNRTYDEFETSGSVESLRAWWLRRMIHTPHPLLEKMTLFWHNHFATNSAKVKSARLMQQHVQLLRGHALGSFEPLLQGVARDPAMLLWLDAGNNRKSQLNDTLARNLMERFSLGAGHFSEADIREAARAFTGWAVLRNRLRYFDREHDSGQKRILGQAGDFDGEDVVRIVLRQAAAPRFLVRKLYRWFVSETETPEDALVGPLAKSFAADYDVSKLVETMLRSNLFFSAAAYRRRIKSPVEFALGIALAFEAMIPTSPLGSDLADLGQNLYNPPTVSGWVGGRHWINPATLIGRSNLAGTLMAKKGPYGGKLDPLAVATKHGFAAPEAAGRFLINLLLQGDLEEKVAEALLASAAEASSKSSPDASDKLRTLARTVAMLPEFQLA